MNIIFTAAGNGTRFNGHDKPFYRVSGKTLLEWSILSLGLEGDYCVVGRSSWTPEQVDYVKNLHNCSVFLLPQSRGQAEHALIVSKNFDPDSELLIVNCDQFTPWDYRKFQNFVDNSDYDGIVTTYPHGDFEIGKPSKYSHILLKDNVGVKLAEKLAISEYSLNGLFYFRKCRDFVDSANLLINSLKNGEAYVSLVYNFMISNCKKIGIYEMRKEEFVSLGSIDEIEKNLEKLI